MLETNGFLPLPRARPAPMPPTDNI